MSKSLKKNHWTNKVQESVLCRNEEGELGLELEGGAENGQFPVVGELLPGGAARRSGKLCPEELLLEVNDTPVAGLTTRDVHAVVKHSKDPVRLKCVKQGEASFTRAQQNFPAFRIFLVGLFCFFFPSAHVLRKTVRFLCDVTAGLLSPRTESPVLGAKNKPCGEHLYFFVLLKPPKVYSLCRKRLVVLLWLLGGGAWCLRGCVTFRAIRNYTLRSGTQLKYTRMFFFLPCTQLIPEIYICVCVYMYMCIYIYTYKYVYTCIYIYVYMTYFVCILQQ